MRHVILVGVAVSVGAVSIVLAQEKTKPTAATFISDAEIKKVAALKAGDRTIKVVDIGNENLAIGFVHRNSTAAGRGAGAGAGRAATPVPASEPCGQQDASAPSGLGGTLHDQQSEGYYILSGSGTLATGGHLINGRKSAADSETTKVLNGPSCSGTIAGADIVRKPVNVGDIVVIPAGVPHAWVEIPDHLDYLVFRPSARVLEAGYIDPVIRAAQ